MATTTFLRIGPNSGSLVDFVAPQSMKPLSFSVEQQRTQRRTKSGALFVRLQGLQKVSTTLYFEVHSKADFDAVIAYCNVAEQYWLQVRDSTDNFFDGFAMLFYNEKSLDVKKDPYKLSFEIQLIEV